jgi:KDO2-lipid IV(A) lauroyltransferase
MFLSTGLNEITVRSFISLLKWSPLSLLLRFLEFAVSFFSFTRISKIGRILGLLFFYVIRIRRKTVFLNLKIALPQLSSQHRYIARQSYAALGMNIMEFLYMSRAQFSEINSCMSVYGWKNYVKAAGKGHGVIVVTGHFGNFDLLACSQALKDVPLAILSKNLSSAGINSEWMRVRERFGLKIFGSNETRKVLLWLKAGNVLGLVTDQRISSRHGGIAVPFFSKKVWTSSAAAKLAQHSGAVLLPVVSQRVAPGRHVMRIEEPLMPVLKNDGSVDLFKTMKIINLRLETWIIEAPENWMWLHRRFKNSI